MKYKKFNKKSLIGKNSQFVQDVFTIVTNWLFLFLHGKSRIMENEREGTK